MADTDFVRVEGKDMLLLEELLLLGQERRGSSAHVAWRALKMAHVRCQTLTLHTWLINLVFKNDN